jgi:hypothetical protein
MILQTKIDLESLLVNNWNATPIHWEGIEYDPPSSVTEWIRVAYNPNDFKHACIDNNALAQHSTIDAFVYADTPFKVLELTESLVDLLNGKKFSNAYVSGCQVIRRGFVNGKYYSYSIFFLNSLI